MSSVAREVVIKLGDAYSIISDYTASPHPVLHASIIFAFGQTVSRVHNVVSSPVSGNRSDVRFLLSGDALSVDMR